MSVHRRNDGWRVRWRDADGEPHSKQFSRKGDADDFDRKLKRAKQIGPVAMRELESRGLTLGRFYETGFRTHAAKLSERTREQYAWAMKCHLSELAGERLAALDVPRLDEHQSYLLESGRSTNTVRDALTRLGGILQVAVDHGRIPANPMRSLRKVAAEPREEVNPLSPFELEAVLARLEGRDRIIVILGGHLGLRPIEVRRAPWQALDLDAGHLTISRARTKTTAARSRVIAIPRTDIDELRRWFLRCGRPEPKEPIVCAEGGGELTKSGIVQWAIKRLQPVTKVIAGRTDVTAYTLRHSHASALHYCDYTVPSITRRLGHSAQVHYATYAHVIDALEGERRYADLDELIAAARRRPAVRLAEAHADRDTFGTRQERP